MSDEYTELERLAKEATPGPYEVSSYENYIGWSIYAPNGAGCIAERWYPTERSEDVNERMKATAQLFAACYPEVILKLIQKARVQTQLVEALEYMMEAFQLLNDEGESQGNEAAEDLSCYIIAKAALAAAKETQ